MRPVQITRREIFALLTGCVFALDACSAPDDDASDGRTDGSDDRTDESDDRTDVSDDQTDASDDQTDAADDQTADDGAVPDACVPPTALMHDTNAQALYLDGSNGPLTGVITVAMVAARETITLEFWHGHGGISHRFTLEPAHFEALLRGERITVGTSTVEDHAHTLFIDPRDEAYRVSGAPDVPVSLGC